VKIAASGLSAGAGGSVSVRDDGLVWIKSRGCRMDRIVPRNLCGIDLATGKLVAGKRPAPPEAQMHLAVYRVRPEVTALFHARSPWAAVVVDSGLELKAMFAEFVNDLGRAGTMVCRKNGRRSCGEAVGKFARNHDTIFVVKGGVVALGVNMKQAFFRLAVAEDAAKSLAAATVVGKPMYLTPAQKKEILSLGAVQHRTKVLERKI
jgi:L-fuculose-phosphate aldolase